MAFSRALLLKGLAGASAVTAGGLGIGYRKEIGNLFRSKEKEGGGVNGGQEALVSEGGGNKGVGEKVKGVNGKLGRLGLEGDCLLDDSADPSSFSRECSIDEGKLKKIQFSNKGKEDLKVSGEVPSDLKLKIEGNKEDISFSFSGLGQDLAIFGDKSKGKIILKNDKKFTVEDGRLTKGNGSEEIEKLNEQLGKFNAPLECRFDESETEDSIECPVAQKELKEMKFSNRKGKEDHRIDGSIPGGLKLKVDKDQQNEMSIYFTGLNQNLTIYGYQNDGKIVVKGSETKFKVGEEGRLEKVVTAEDLALIAQLKKFNKQLGTINAPIECRFDDSGADESFECPITQDQFEKLGFSNEGTSTLTVKTWPSSGNVKLKVEKDSKNAMSITFPGLATSSPVTIYGGVFKGKIVVRGDETKFTVVNGQLTKESSNVDETLKSKLGEFNSQLGGVGAPVECRFDEAETEDSMECDVSNEQLKIMAFYGGEFSELTYDDENFSGMKLKIQISKTVDSDTKEENKVLTFIFKDYDKTFNLLDKSDDEIVSFVKGTNPEFGIYDIAEDYGSDELLVLGKIWEPETFAELLGLKCNTKNKRTPIECTFDPKTKKIKVGNGTEDDPVELDVTDTDSKFELHEDEENYNQGFKFVYSGKRVPENGDSGVGLESGSSYELKWKVKEGEPRTFYLAKKG